MVSLKVKKIKNKEYLYAEYSFRLPDNKIKKISKLIKNKQDINSKYVLDYFLNKEIISHQKFALNKYKKTITLTENKIKEIELYKIKYKYLLKKFTKKQIEDIIDRFTINFTYETNSIEGNSLTLKDVTLLLDQNILPKNKNLREIYEIKNTKNVMPLIFKKKIKISIGNILKIHKIIIKDTGVSFGFKKIPNYLLMRNVKTTSPENVSFKIQELIEWYYKNKLKLHPLHLISYFYTVFEKNPSF